MLVDAYDHLQVQPITAATNDMVTKAFVLHPVICGILWLDLIVVIGANLAGSLMATLVSGVLTVVAWIMLLVLIAIDFTVFGFIKDTVNSHGSVAYYDNALWCVVAAFVLLIPAAALVMAPCLLNRRERRRQRGAGTASHSTYPGMGMRT